MNDMEQIKRSRRTKKVISRSYEEVDDGEKFTLRKIIRGLITDSEYIGKFLALKDGDPVKLLGVNFAKRIANWCIEFYNEHHTAPGDDIAWQYVEGMKNLSEDDRGDIEDLLQGLSDEHQGNKAHLFTKTVKFLQLQQIQEHNYDVAEAIRSNNVDEFCKSHSSFKLIHPELEQQTEHTFTELYNMKIKPQQWLIKDLLPKGLTIFAGEAKLGKSYLAFNMAIHLAQGKWMFNEQSDVAYRGKMGPVLYLALEDPTERLQNRMRAIDPDPDLVLCDKHLIIRKKWPKLFSEGGLKNLEEWLKGKERPKLIVIDVGVKVLNIKDNTGAGRYYNEEYKNYAPLAELAHDYKTSIIVITHTTKGKQSNVFNEILGGEGTKGPADNLMVLSRYPHNPNQRILSILGKDIEEKHLLFEVFNKGAKWECLGETSEVQKTNERQSIVDYLTTHGTKSLQDIQQACKDGNIEASHKSVHILLRTMVRDGELTQPKYGLYSVPGRTNGMIKIKQPGRRLLE